MATIAAITASTDSYFETVADRQVVKLNNKRFPGEALSAIATFGPKAAIGSKRFPALSSIATVAVETSDPLCACDRFAFIKTPAAAASTPIAAARLPDFLPALDAC